MLSFVICGYIFVSNLFLGGVCSERVGTYSCVLFMFPTVGMRAVLSAVAWVMALITSAPRSSTPAPLTLCPALLSAPAATPPSWWVLYIHFHTKRQVMDQIKNKSFISAFYLKSLKCWKVLRFAHCLRVYAVLGCLKLHLSVRCLSFIVYQSSKSIGQRSAVTVFWRQPVTDLSVFPVRRGPLAYRRFLTPYQSSYSEIMWNNAMFFQ